MIIVGLTGSIGMGKSTAAAMLQRMGVPVYDADAAVHALQARNGPALPAIEASFPGVVKDGVLDRAALGTRVFGSKPALPWAARDSWCSTSRCCSKGWASAGSTPLWW